MEFNKNKNSFSFPLLSVFLILVFAISFFSQEASAAVFTWTGAVDRSWSNPANWSPVGVPSPSDTVFISSPFCPTTQATGILFDPVGSYTFSGTLDIGASCFLIDQDISDFTNQGIINIFGNYFVSKWKNDSMGTATVSSGGQLVFSGGPNENYGDINNNNFFTIAAGGILVNRPSGTINHNTGGIWSVAFSSSQFINAGGQVYSDARIHIVPPALYENSGPSAIINTDCNHTITGGGSILNTAGGTIVDVCSPPPAPSTPDLKPGSDTGSSDSDDITKITTPTFTVGGVVSGDTVQLYVDAVASGSSVVSSGSSVSLTSGTLTPDGLKLITAKATNGGGTGPPSSALPVTIDTTPPTTPGNPDLDALDDTGILDTDNITMQTTALTFSGTADTGTTAKLFDGFTQIASQIASSYNFDVSLTEGAHSLSVSSTDTAGNTASSGSLSVTIDTVAPSPTLEIDGNPVPYDRTFSTSVSLETTCGDGLGSGCATFVVGGADITNPTFPDPSETFAASRAATLTAGRDPAKSAEISLVTDYAGNVATGPFSDTIALDARILTVAPSTTTPYWNVNLNIDGTVENALPLDHVKVRFGSPTETDTLIEAGVFSVTGQYPRLSLEPNPHTPNATLTDSSDNEIIDSTGTRVSTLGPDVEIQRHPTELQVDEMDTPGTEKPVIVKGVLDDTLVGFGFPNGVPVSVVGTNGEDFVASVTGGITIEDDAGLEIAACGDCLPATNVAKFNEGTGEIRIDTTPSPTAVTVSMADNGPDKKNVVFEITSGPTDDDPSGVPTENTVTLLGGEGNAVTFQNVVGISKIRIVDVSDDTTLQVYAISSTEVNGVRIHSVEFSGLTPVTTTDPITLGDGTFFSKGTAPTFVGDFDITVNSGNIDYAPPTSVTRTYLTVESLAGGTGGATNNILDVSGTLFTSRTCVGSGGDTDRDAICNDWETAGGVPFVVTTGASPSDAPYVYDLTPNPSTSNRDIYYEIDYMNGHNPIDAALSGVASVFSSISSPINLYFDEDDVIPHHAAPPAQQWIDAFADTDDIDDDDFNSLKNNYYGDVSERSTISIQSLQVEDSTFPALGSSATSGNYRVNVTGITVLTTPNTPAALGNGATSGTIDIKFKVNCGVTCTVTTISIPSVNSVTGINVRTPTASVSTDTTSIKVVTITVPYWTTVPIGSGGNPVGVLGNVGVHIHVVNSAAANINTLTDAAFTTKAGSPGITSTLLDAKAQVVRYMMFVHNTTGASGQGERLGNDIIISLTGFGGDSDGFGGTQGTLEEQKGTIMHEIGHNLNLKHGGPQNFYNAAAQQGLGALLPADRDYNCKPNYASIMSYSRQLPAFFGVSFWNSYNVLNFSDGGLTSLIESSLKESAAATGTGTFLTNTDGTVPRIVWASPIVSPNTPTHAAPDHTSHNDTASATSYDWNDSEGTVNLAAVSVNVNHFGIRECDNPSAVIRTTATNDYNDWANINFDFRGIAATFDGSDADKRQNAKANNDNSKKDTLPPGKTQNTANSGSSVPFKARLVDTNVPPATITTITPDPYSGYIQKSTTDCTKSVNGGIQYTTIPGNFVWEDSTKHLKLVYKSLKADKGKTYCFIAHVTTLNSDVVVFDEVPPNNQVVKDVDNTRVTWKVKFS